MKKISFIIYIFILISFISSCSSPSFNDEPHNPNDNNLPNSGQVDEPSQQENEEIIADPGEVNVDTDYTITCVSGTENAYVVDGDTITFNTIFSDSVYAITGSLDGNIVIDVSDSYKFELQFVNFTISSSFVNPITILSGDEVQITAKKDTLNYVYDYREVVDSTDTSLYSACIYSVVDLDIGGKGKLEVYSKNNNGIHTKDDLKVKNLTLNVVCNDNALKGNDGVTIESGTIKLVAKAGDGIKTTNSHINDNNNQKGTVTILDANLDIYVACDGIDSAYDVIVSGESANVNIYTDKYSGYSDVVTDINNSSYYYIRYSSSSYKFSIKYYNSETSEYKWENASYDSQSGRYNFYKINKPAGYDKLDLYIYSSLQEQAQDSDYVKVYNMTVNDNYDTLAVSSRGSCDWTNYSSNQGGFDGMGGTQEGNSDKGEYSTKGIKANNQISIYAGNIKINSYDDSIHANNTTTLENGSTALGSVTISGGNLTLYSNDDGIHSDGNLIISGGNIIISYSYEGIEGYIVEISGGYIGINSKDDGINATSTSGVSINLSGGDIYIFASGDGIDSNSTTSYSGISFSGSNVVVISNSNGNSAIDTERGYLYSSGKVVAIMPSGGMSSEATNCSNFSSIATKKSSLSLSESTYLTVTVSNTVVCAFKMPVSINGAMVIYLGSNGATIQSVSNLDYTFNSSGVYWN